MRLVRNNLPAIVTLLIVLAFGVFGGTLLTRVGYLAVPSAVGLPYGLPGLRVTPIGETSWLGTLTDALLALALVAMVALTRGGFWRTWGAFLAGAVLVDVVRAVFLAQDAGTMLGAYAGYLAGGLVTGLIWGIALGWLPALGALTRRGRSQERSTAGINSMG
ncbi:hypothetical protein HII36_13690 [Nonomuraea sp. NN258]|uniref:hypothetical protein n=1 Tax=Nonomuraea antri TaxID=2730852 RepID=UPI001568FD02|nr:hypothetical protein [Nonomuraea antri]NRQ32885.1 hypothetical protein [Nonomuraea antri]